MTQPVATRRFGATRTGNLLLFARTIQTGEHLLNYPERFREGGNRAFGIIVQAGTRRAEEVLQLVEALEQKEMTDIASDYWQRFLAVIATMPVNVIRQEVFQTPSRAACAAWLLLIFAEAGFQRRGTGTILADQVLELLEAVPLAPEPAEFVVQQLTSLLTKWYDRP